MTGVLFTLGTVTLTRILVVPASAAAPALAAAWNPQAAAAYQRKARFATRFGFPSATLRNREERRSRPGAPTRVLLAVIARRPDAVEDVLIGSR